MSSAQQESISEEIEEEANVRSVSQEFLEVFVRATYALGLNKKGKERASWNELPAFVTKMTCLFKDPVRPSNRRMSFFLTLVPISLSKLVCLFVCLFGWMDGWALFGSCRMSRHC
jgi:hypothetical protein